MALSGWAQFGSTRNVTSKYNAKKTVIDGITFDSKKEANRYMELKMLRDAGEITFPDQWRQVRFEIIPPFMHDGKKIRASYYVADFVYYDKNGNMVVEDVKGVRTALYNLKKKLVLWRHGIEIKET